MEGLPSSLKAVRLLRLLRLMKLARMLRAARTLTNWKNRLNIRFTKLEILKCFAIIVASSHWMACSWGLVATIQEQVEYQDDGETTQTWFSILECGADCHQGDNLLSTPYLKYVTALYFAVRSFPIEPPRCPSFSIEPPLLEIIGDDPHNSRIRRYTSGDRCRTCCLHHLQ